MRAASPSVTALLPAYNAAAFIDETLQSLAAQTYPNFHVLISVDVSTDDTADRCERFAHGDARFTVVRQVRRLGWIDNSRDLLRRAESDLCFFMGHDDVVEPEYVEALVAALVANPRAVMACSDVEVCSPDGKRVTRAYAELDGVTQRLDRGKIALKRIGTWFITYRALFRTSAARRGCPLRKHLAGEFAADWPFLLHFALHGECVRVPRLLYRKRYRTTGLSHEWRSGVLPWMAVNLCCGKLIMQADLSPSERVALLPAVARRIAKDLVMPVLLLPRRIRKVPGHLRRILSRP